MNDKFLSIEDKVEEDAAQMEIMKIMMNAMQQQVVENYRTFLPKWIFFHPSGSPAFDKLL